jgi:hypothetical protein
MDMRLATSSEGRLDVIEVEHENKACLRAGARVWRMRLHSIGLVPPSRGGTLKCDLPYSVA